MKRRNLPTASPSSLILVAALVAGIVGCTFETAEGTSESVSTNSQAITAACSMASLGLPCDPDGSGAASECEGMCWVDPGGAASCRGVADLDMEAVDLNGRICGDSTGADCSRSCENGSCVTKNARLGSACRPGGTGTTCDGLCTLLGGAPVCDAVVACDSVGASGCTLTACGFDDNTTGCVDYSVPATTPCDDGFSCTTGDACTESGACVAAEDSCEPGTGPGTVQPTGGASSSATGAGGNPAVASLGGIAGMSPQAAGANSTSAAPAELTGGGCSASAAPLPTAPGAWLAGLILFALAWLSNHRSERPLPKEKLCQRALESRPHAAAE